MSISGSGRLALETTVHSVDLDSLSIRIESPASDAAQRLVRQSADGEVQYDDLTAPNFELLVARLGGEPVGCITLVDHLRYGEACRLFVSEEVRGRGIALALVEALEAAARDIGLRRIRIAQPVAARASLRPFTRKGYRATEDTWMEKAL